MTDTGLSNGLLDMTAKAQLKKMKKLKWLSSKLKIFVLQWPLSQ